MATDAVSVSCAHIRRPDVETVDQLARIGLWARRSGREVCLEDASDELIALIELAGLGEVLRVEVKRKAEQRKEPRRVEEEGDLGDLSV